MPIQIRGDIAGTCGIDLNGRVAQFVRELNRDRIERRFRRVVAKQTELRPLGPPGAGTAYKLLVNMLGAVQIASVAEVIAIAEKIGLDLRMVADALATGQAASPQVIRNARRMIAGHSDQTVVFTPKLRLKDVEYALALAQKLEIGSPFGVLAAQVYRRLNDLGYASSNESEVIEVARQQPPEQCRS